MGGCVDNWYEIEFVRNVLKYVHKLEQMVVTCEFLLAFVWIERFIEERSLDERKK